MRDQSDIDALAAIDGDRIQILVWNYHDDLVAAEPARVTLRVTVPPAFGPYAALTHTRVDEMHGDAYTVWVSQSSPAALALAAVASHRRPQTRTYFRAP